MKNKLIIIPVLLIVAFIATFVIIQLQKWKKEKKQITAGITHAQDTTTHWLDDLNMEHARSLSFQQDIEVAKLLHEDEMKKAEDLLDVKQKQIEGLQKIVAKIRGTFTAIVDTIRSGDTTASTFHIDSFSTFQTATIGDRETVTYNIRVPVHLTQYWKRPHSFLGINFGDPVHYIDGWSDNKNVTLDSLSNVRILTKAPGRWGAGPFIGFGTSGWAVGISVHYSILRW